MSTPQKQIQNQGKPDHRPVASKTNKAAFDKRPHTPGPWKADKWATGYSVSTPEGGYTVCRLDDCNNAEANAKLIASAPDLLAAAIAHLDAYGENACECIEKHNPNHCPHCQLRAAIAKATT